MPGCINVRQPSWPCPASDVRARDRATPYSPVRFRQATFLLSHLRAGIRMGFSSYNPPTQGNFVIDAVRKRFVKPAPAADFEPLRYPRHGTRTSASRSLQARSWILFARPRREFAADDRGPVIRAAYKHRVQQGSTDPVPTKPEPCKRNGPCRGRDLWMGLGRRWRLRVELHHATPSGPVVLGSSIQIAVGDEP